MVEEGRFHDPVLRVNFIQRALIYRRWQDLVHGGIAAHAVIDFHSRHKLAILNPDQQGYREPARPSANAGVQPSGWLADSYLAGLMSALMRGATRRNHAKVLRHHQGHLKRRVDRHDEE